MSKETLQIAEEKKKSKNKGEKERYTHEYRVPKNSKEI